MGNAFIKPKHNLGYCSKEYGKTLVRRKFNRKPSITFDDIRNSEYLQSIDWSCITINTFTKEKELFFEKKY